MSSPPPTNDHSPRATSNSFGRTAQLSAELQPRLFAYGTLQFPEVLDALLERKPTLIAGIASGWRAVRLRNRIYPALIRDDATTTGCVISDLSPSEWQVIDAFEDDIYDLSRLDVGGRACWAYTNRTPLGGNLTDGAAWDRDVFATRRLTSYVECCRSWRNDVRANAR